MVPLPDADPDKRMYKLLKNIDLENLTFEQFQSTAQTVFAEPESEDTLRRIVLINLSRMAVAGQWNGLTTAGGSTPGTGGYVSNYWYAPMSNGASAAVYALTADKLYLVPITTTADMSLEALTAYVSTAVGGSNVRIGIYNYNSTGLGGTLLAEGGTASSASTGWKIMSGMSTTVSQGHYFLALQSDAAISVYRFNSIYGQTQLPLSLVEAAPEQIAFFGARYNVAYSAGMTDLTSLTPDAFDYYQIIIEMRPA